MHVWEKSQIWEKLKDKSEFVKNLFDGTVWLEKLKFPEKSQIWENHSVGDSDASADSRTTEEASTTSAIKATSTTMFIGNGHINRKQFAKKLQQILRITLF